MTERVDWAALLRTGTLGLGLAPEAVWALSPWEFAALAGALAPAALDRSGLEALMAAHPDGVEKDDG
jgi:Conserved hypothetical phage protein (DUF2376).